jgi:aminoglycoside 3'-phosphotransferase II
MNPLPVSIPATLQTIIAAADWQEISEGESDARVFRLSRADAVRYLKVAPHTAQFQVKADKVRLDWLAGRVPVPQVLHYAEDDNHQFLLMSALEGLHPMHDNLNWSAEDRITFLAEAARRFHALPVAECPFVFGVDEQLASARHNIEKGLVRTDLFEPQWQSFTPQSLFEKLLSLKPHNEDVVVVHGDLYPMNIRAHPAQKTLLGYIDVGGMGVSDRYTDLAVIANAIEWHLGETWVERFFHAYGIATVDTRKLQFYQLLNEFF